MKDIDLDKYKLAWKKEEVFHKETLSDEEIRAFMQKNSKNMLKLFKSGLAVDIAIKVILGLMFLGLLYLFSSQVSALIVNCLLVLVCVASIVYHLKIYGDIPEEKVAASNIRERLNGLIDFYNRRYVKSLLVAALSGTMLFISGTMYYAYFKYGKIRAFEWDDYLVFGSGIILSFAIAAWVQIKQHNFQIKQLESCLEEIDQDTINEHTIREHQNRRMRNVILFGIFLILGLLILLFFVAT